MNSALVGSHITNLESCHKNIIFFSTFIISVCKDEQYLLFACLEKGIMSNSGYNVTDS